MGLIPEWNSMENERLELAMNSHRKFHLGLNFLTNSK
jgi:hypothetical protein